MTTLIRTAAKLDPLVDQVLRAFRRVHGQLGPGFGEDVYRQALAVELREWPLRVAERPTLPVAYRGQSVGEAIVDLVVNGDLIVAVATTRFLTVHAAAQVESLVRATGRSQGLLLNFGSVAEHRLILPDA